MASPYLRIAPLLAVLAIGCGVDLPNTPTTVLPKSGEPATIELSANPGVGPNGGTATITARVLDGVFALVPNTTVTFTATAGTLASQAVQTDDKGIATTTLTATPGTVKVSATAGSVHSTETAVSIQPVNVFVPPPPGPVPPPPLPDPKPQPPAPQYGMLLVASPSSVVTGSPTTLSATVSPQFGAPPVTSWVWDCDIATPATDATTVTGPSCTYATAGTFTAGLRVAGGSTVGFAVTTVTVTAAPPPPVIPFFVSVAAAPAGPVTTGSSVVFTATLSSTAPVPTHLEFDWDDDNNGGVDATTTTNTRTVTVVAASPTVWKTSVKVTDLDTGRTATGLGQLTVNP